MRPKSRFPRSTPSGQAAPNRARTSKIAAHSSPSYGRSLVVRAFGPTGLARSLGDAKRNRAAGAPELVTQIGLAARHAVTQPHGTRQKLDGASVDVEFLKVQWLPAHTRPSTNRRRRCAYSSLVLVLVTRTRARPLANQRFERSENRSKPKPRTAAPWLRSSPPSRARDRVSHWPSRHFARAAFDRSAPLCI
jgi:hypothetical protein